MRTLLLTAAFLLAALTPARAELGIDFHPPAHLKSGVDVPLDVKITHGKSPAHGAEAEAVLSMVDMDHGNETVPATEVKPGVYRFTAKFLMSGAWRIRVHAAQNGDSLTREFRVEVEE